ncbi:dolichyl-phosphate-mannose--protein mannosyltransferase [Arthrobacter luteolus]|uniref:dolichyl-phosphate-mannose--protein mannosyltransferase n=1 Tax=Arthrobacter luteolus TaxID=98672 RepID=UPI0009F8E74B|nr:phospholipid carrier-dependent glycosyltransferase [Arthrobacter luteolus]
MLESTPQPYATGYRVERVTLSLTPSPPREQTPPVLDPGQAFSFETLRGRLLGAALPAPAWAWAAALGAAVLAGVLRFVRLGEPDSLVFDETYYVKDAYSYLMSGYERAWPENANDSFAAGQPSGLLEEPEYVVHPPVGKWMIAFGMALFGPGSSFGWRFSAALAGTLTVLLLALIAYRLFRSPLLGGAAGVLLAVDGHHLVLSRTSLLDVFLAFWVLAAFGALLLDRDDGRRRLARKLAVAPGSAPPFAALASGPWLLWRPWRLVAGVCLGLAVGTKWSALALVAVFGLMTVLWDVSARRVAGIRRWPLALLKDGVPAFFTLIPTALATYTATWAGWFRASDSYGRHWAETNPSETFGWFPDSLRSLAEYHRSAYEFHNGLTSEHSYMANAWTWLFMGRPTSFFYESPDPGSPGCGFETCTSAITSVGNPLIWWAALLSLGVLLAYWLGRRDWRAGAILAGIAAGYLPWFAFPDRTMFFFYAVSFEPFLILALTYVLGLMLGRDHDTALRRKRGAVGVGCFLLAVILVSAFFYPVWTAENIPYSGWRLRMWMPSWI